VNVAHAPIPVVGTMIVVNHMPGAYDDPNGSHISIEVVSPKFEGKRPVQRQQLVYKAIWEELQGPVHAVDSMVCRTPSEAAKLPS
jgi:stress-induced morphogen